MKLYSYYRSSCSYRVRIALNYKNISYDYIPVHLIQNGGEQRKDTYRKLNPKQEVPTLQNENITLAQSMAIFLYLDRLHIENPLFPKEFPYFEKCIELCEIINSGIQPIQNLSVLQKLQKDFSASDEKRNSWCQHFIKKGLEAYQEKLSLSQEGPYSMGEEVTAADMFLIPQLYNAHRFNVDMTNLKRLLDIEKNCLALKFFTNASPSTQPDAS